MVERRPEKAGVASSILAPGTRIRFLFALPAASLRKSSATACAIVRRRLVLVRLWGPLARPSNHVRRFDSSVASVKADTKVLWTFALRFEHLHAREWVLERFSLRRSALQLHRLSQQGSVETRVADASYTMKTAALIPFASSRLAKTRPVCTFFTSDEGRVSGVASLH